MGAMGTLDNYQGDAVGVHGFVNAALVSDLRYLPFVAAAVHAIFFVIIIAHFVRQQFWTPNNPPQKELGVMHRKVKWICIGLFVICGLLLLNVLWMRTHLSIHGVVLFASNTLAWLTISITLQGEEAQDRAVFHGILRAWWAALLALSTFALGGAFSVGPLSSTVLDFAFFVSSLFLVIIGCTDYAYRDGNVAELNSAKEPLLVESFKLPDNAAFQSPSTDSAFSRAGALSVLTFSWLNPLLSAGNKKALIIQDVPSLDPADDANTNFEAFQECWERDMLNIPDGTSPSLAWTLLKTFWQPFIVSILLTFVWTGAMFVGPILQNFLITFMEEEHRTFRVGATLVLILLTGKLVEALSVHQLGFRSRKLGLCMWAGVSRAVYNKSLRLSLKARQVRSVGEITNLLSTDVQRLLELIYYVQQGLAFPLQLVISVIILFEVVGIAMLVGLSMLVIVVLANIFNIGRMRTYRGRLLRAKDKRMQATTECLGNMKVIKLQGWDEMFEKRIEQLRLDERDWVQKFMYTWAITISTVWTGPLAVSAVTFLTVVLLGEPLSTARVFTALTTFKIIQEPIRFIPDVIANAIQASVSFRRIRLFLMEEEVDENSVESTLDDVPYVIDIEHASFSWDKLATAPAIDDLTLRIKKGTCVAICGGVGSGKSSLLYCIMGELPKLSGSAKLSGRVAYVAQSAWIQNNSIRQNILFGRAMDLKRYSEAVRVSGLEADLAQFPAGDVTEIGERGTNLSGGQKQRIQLARAVYQDADVYLLDDPFSAVDAHTGTFLFEECVKGALREKTVILVTHQVEFLPAADFIIVMKAPGEIVQQGTYSELLQEGKDFGSFVEALQQSLQTVTRASHINSDGEPHALLDSTSDRTLGTSLSANVDELTAEISGLVSRTPSLPQDRDSVVANLGESETNKLIEDEMRATGSVDWRVIWTYLTKVRRGVVCLLVFIPQLTTTACQISSDTWLARKASNGDLHFIEIYILLVAGCSMSVLLRTITVAYAGVATAQAFFLGMLRSIIRAPMSFIDSTPLGRILSRSSTDQTALDLELPNSCAGVGNSSVQLFGSILITTYVTPQIFVLIFPLAIIYFQLRNYYIQSARELSRLTALTEAPVFLHISESIAGATTIRAFQEQRRFADTNAQRLECYQKAYFHNLTATEWLGLRLDSLAALVLSAAAVLLITLPEGTIAPGLAGLELSYGLTLGALLMRLVTASSNVENKMVSVERISQYSNIPSEAPAVILNRRPASGWPNAGRIELQQLQIRYRPGAPLVLKGVSCVIHPREKVGVVGRTGSGKSTLVQALFRIVEPAGGRILVDGLDISTIGLSDLRSVLCVIPQEPTLFEGSVRSNLDPFNLCSDDQIWETLDKCQLGQVVREKPLKLHASVSEQGENWSVGERQLLCLGRALLKQARILVLDEATASVDITTDALIQSTIKQYFAQCTVISIAHRIPTVIDSDRVLVLDAGHLMENSSPEHLLVNENSMFSKLVQEYTQRTGSNSNLDSLNAH